MGQGSREMESTKLQTGARIEVHDNQGSVDPDAVGPAQGGEPVRPRRDGSEFSVEVGEKKKSDGSVEADKQ